jgi:hypothetical protein
VPGDHPCPATTAYDPRAGYDRPPRRDPGDDPRAGSDRPAPYGKPASADRLGSEDGPTPQAGAAADDRVVPPDGSDIPDANPRSGLQHDLGTDLRSDEVFLETGPRPAEVAHIGSRPPTYDPEPTVLPAADPGDLGDLVADTVLDGARYGACTLRAASVRGDSARYRGEPRRDSLLTARFGAGEHGLVLVAMATGARAAPRAHRAAAEACEWIGRVVGRSHVRLAEDIRTARRGDLKAGLHRLTDHSLGKLRASAVEQGIEPQDYTADLRCLLLPADPTCRTRVFFGVGAGGLFRLRDGEWRDIEPRVAATAGAPLMSFGSPPDETPEGHRLTMDLGIAMPPSPYAPAPARHRAPFRFRASVASPGDTLLLCTAGFADPLRGEPGLADHLTTRWATAEPPGLAAFFADTQVRVKGYADDRTAVAVWEE